MLSALRHKQQKYESNLKVISSIDDGQSINSGGTTVVKIDDKESKKVIVPLRLAPMHQEGLPMITPKFLKNLQKVKERHYEPIRIRDSTPQNLIQKETFDVNKPQINIQQGKAPSDFVDIILGGKNIKFKPYSKDEKLRPHLDVTQMSINSTLSNEFVAASSGLDLNEQLLKIPSFKNGNDPLNLTAEVVVKVPPPDPELALDIRLMSQSPHGNRRNQSYHGLLTEQAATMTNISLKRRSIRRQEMRD